MKYRQLGRTGLEVSEIAHGLWGMSDWSGSDDRQSLDALQLAVDLGCNFFDTAWAYGGGKSDGLLGKVLSANRGSACTPPPRFRHSTISGRRPRRTNTAMSFPRSMFSNMPS